VHDPPSSRAGSLRSWPSGPGPIPRAVPGARQTGGRSAISAAARPRAGPHGVCRRRGRATPPPAFGRHEAAGQVWPRAATRAESPAAGWHSFREIRGDEADKHSLVGATPELIQQVVEQLAGRQSCAASSSSARCSVVVDRDEHLPLIADDAHALRRGALLADHVAIVGVVCTQPPVPLLHRSGDRRALDRFVRTTSPGVPSQVIGRPREG
jgi:hypothetical protein